MAGSARSPAGVLRRGVVAGACITLLAAGSPTGALAQVENEDSGLDRLAVREVQTVETGRLGMHRPVGIAYDPVRREFLVAGESDKQDATPFLRLGRFGDGRGTFSIRDIATPSTIAFDESNRSLIAIDGASVVDVSARELFADDPATHTRQVPRLDVDVPESAAIAGDSQTLYVLDQAGTVVITDLSTSKEESTEVALPIADGNRMIALNPVDGLLYVLAPEADRLDAIDGDGNLSASYDTSSAPWLTPEAMTFAPSTDNTDEPSIHHLYVADSGTDEVGGGIVEVTLTQLESVEASTDAATLVRAVPTSEWSPPSTDPSGVTWFPQADRLLVADSEIEEIPTLFQNVNLWSTTRTGVVEGTGTTYGVGSAANYSSEPTGLSYDSGTDTLFVSDDDAYAIYVVKRGPDGVIGTSDDVVTTINVRPLGVSDTEDPAFDAVTGHLFFLSGIDREIYRIDPVDGVFGNGNDVITHFDISHLGPTDFEGLAKAPTRQTLYVGARTTRQIFEIAYDGTLIRVIDARGVLGLRFISGLTVAPSTLDASTMSLYIVDRGVDEINDGVLYEISAPAVSDPGTNLPPNVDAGFNEWVTLNEAVTLLGVVADDGLPSGTVTQTWSVDSGPGEVTFADATAAMTTATFSAVGVYVLRLTASDGEYSSSAQVTITVTSANQPPVVEPIADVVVGEGESVVVPVVVSDPDGDSLTVTSEGLPSFGSFDEEGSAFTLSPVVGQAGSYGPVTVTVTEDGSGVPEYVAPEYVSSVSVATGTSTNTMAIPRPGGVEAGDLLLAQVRFRGTSASELTSPPGWTLVGSLSDTHSNHAVFYRVASGSEATSYSFVQESTGGKMAGAVAAYRGVDLANPIDAWAASATNTPTLEAPNAVASVPNATVVRLWGFRSYHDGTGLSGNQPPAGVTARWESFLNAGAGSTDRNRVLGGDHVQALPGAVGTATATGATGTSENRRSSFTVILRPN